jgi:hypothetical protein
MWGIESFENIGLSLRESPDNIRVYLGLNGSESKYFIFASEVLPDYSAFGFSPFSFCRRIL